MLYKKPFTLIFLIMIFTLNSCHYNITKLSEDKKITDVLGKLTGTEVSSFINHLDKNPKQILFNPNKNINCIKIDDKRIYIPAIYKESKLMTELYTVKALYLNYLNDKYKFEENFTELEQLLIYYQINFFFKYSYISSEIEKDKLFINYFAPYLCAYLISKETLDEMIIKKTQTHNRECSYPLENLDYFKKFYNSLKKSFNTYGNDYFQLMYQREIDKVKRGLLTKEEAEKNYYYIVSDIQGNLYREKREYIQDHIYNFSKFEKLYRKQIKIFKKNQNNYKNILQQLSFCKKAILSE